MSIASCGRPAHGGQRSIIAKVLTFMSAAMLVFQLVGAAHQGHEHKRFVADCASCVLAAQLQSPPLDRVAGLTMVSKAELQCILPSLVMTDGGRGITRPIARAQGPPADSAV